MTLRAPAAKVSRMSSALLQPTPLSVEEYLAGEEQSEVRHEFIAGAVYAMSGASEPHNIIALNIASALRAQLRGRRCRAFMADMKLRLRILEDDVFYYPDVMVACDPTDRASHYKERPTILFEVLSDTTAHIDRREKFFSYRSIPTLENYVLVEQEQRLVTILRRRLDWAPERLREPDDILRLDGIECALTLADIYEESGV